MNKRFKKFVSLLLSISIIAITAVTPVSALTYSGSSSYMSGKYYTALKKVELTGNQRTDIVNIGLSQVGYQESSSSSQLSGTIKGSKNYTEYGRWYGLQDMWCAMFVSWCANVAGVSTSVVPKHCYTPSGLSWFKSRGRAYSRATVASGGYTPQPGDIIYFKSSRNENTTNHVGIVTSYSGKTVYTVEGNTSSATISTDGGAVAAKSYSISNTYIVYICNPDYSGANVSQGTNNIYYTACSSSCESITEALNSIGVDSTKAYRTTIAEANGITDYTGTAEQNMAMLSLLKAGKLKKPDAKIVRGVKVEKDYFVEGQDINITADGIDTDWVGVFKKDEDVSAVKPIRWYYAFAENDGIEHQSGIKYNLMETSVIGEGRSADAAMTEGNYKAVLFSDGKAVAEESFTVLSTKCYFPACASSNTTINDGLNSIGVDSSKAYRTQIATVNGIDNYTGTVDQNNEMLRILKSGKLINPDYAADVASNSSSSSTEPSQPSTDPTNPTEPVDPTSTYFPACASSCTTIVEGLTNIGVDSSKTYRTQIAAVNGFENYTGTAEQNTTMLSMLKSGNLVDPSKLTNDLALNKTQYALNEAVMVTAIGNGKDWVGLYKADDKTDSSVTPINKYNVAGTNNGIAHSSGTAYNILTTGDNVIELKAGNYKVVLFDEDSYTVIKEVTFSVVEDVLTGYERGYKGGMPGDGKIYAHGVDVSKWNGEDFDFKNLKDNGYDYVIIRAGSTNLGKDPLFETYYTNARAAGLDIGAYFYTYALNATDAKADAEKFLSYIEGKKFEYPIYLDYEDPSQDNLSVSTATKICTTFMSAIEDAGYLTGIYTGEYKLSSFDLNTVCAKHEMWLARYYDDTYTSLHSKYSTTYGMYQYTDSKYVGSAGPMDANVSYKDYPTIVKTYGFNGYSATVSGGDNSGNTGDTSSKYFPACSSSYTTISDALTSIGVDSSKAYRTTIAAANGIENYTGTAEQNNQMLALLKAGKLLKPVEEEEPTTQTPTTEPTEPPTTEPTTEPTTQAPTTEPTEGTTTTESTIPTIPGLLIGDTNFDGVVNVADATTIQKMVVNSTNVDSTKFAVFDVNNDGVINIIDATTIQKFCVGLTSSFA